MKRTAALLVTTCVVAATPASAFAYAYERGEPHAGSCGVGKEMAHAAVQDQAKPGATEVAHIKPADAGCTGKG
jgi:hypothetical protein